MRHAHHVKRINIHCTKGSTADTAQTWPSTTKDHLRKHFFDNLEQKTCTQMYKKEKSKILGQCKQSI